MAIHASFLLKDHIHAGFACQGNEFSHYMLLASFYMLNRCVQFRTLTYEDEVEVRSPRTDEVDKHTIYPYVHSFSNNPNNEALLRPITIPDVLPSSLPDGSEFSLVAGKPFPCSSRLLALRNHSQCPVAVLDRRFRGDIW